MIASMATNSVKMSGSGDVIQYEDLQSGDYMMVDNIKMVFEEFDEGNIKKYTDKSAPVKPVRIPELKRQIKDVTMPKLMANELTRATPGDYKKIVWEWEDKEKITKNHSTRSKLARVTIIEAPMGWGKTTRFPFYLQASIKERLYITLPSIALATTIRDDL